MARFLILVLIVVGVIWWIKSSRRRNDAVDGDKPKTHANPPNPPPPVPMVTCTTCGMHLPEPDAFQHGGKWYCSTAHIGQDRP